MIPFAYGYDEGYLRTALDILQSKGIFPKTGESLPSGADKDFNDFWTAKVNKAHDFYISVSDVSRRRDLHGAGKVLK